MSYICLECGCEFEEPKHWREHHVDNYYEDMSGCPLCYGSYEEKEEVDEYDYNDEELEG